MLVGDGLKMSMSDYSISIERHANGHYVITSDDHREKGNFIIQFVDMEDYQQLIHLGSLLDNRLVISNINKVIDLEPDKQMVYTNKIHGTKLYSCRKGKMLIFSGKTF